MISEIKVRTLVIHVRHSVLHGRFFVTLPGLARQVTDTNGQVFLTTRWVSRREAIRATGRYA